MKEYRLLIVLIILLAFESKSRAQWLDPMQLSDMNTWSSKAGFIGWYGTTTNTPTSMQYGSGITMLLYGDSRYGTQLVAPIFDNQLFYRQNQAGSWSSWAKIWSTNNFDPDLYLDRSLEYINSSTTTANNFINVYTFAYTTSGTPWNGSLMSFGGFGGGYDTQLNADYGPAGGSHLSFRTKNGDINTWNNWNELYHSGNLNRSDVDFAARTINCSAINANGAASIKNDVGGTLVLTKTSNNIPGIVFQGATSMADIEAGDDYLTTYVGGARRFTILSNGNIGIGTTDPKTYKLAIAGRAIAETMTVQLQGAWGDYVFKPDYNLMPLTDVKTYIDKNQHLPEIPSAAEVAKDGQNLGEMNKLLLKKVEELTLYLIEKDKEIKELSGQLKIIQAQLKQQK